MSKKQHRRSSHERRLAKNGIVNAPHIENVNKHRCIARRMEDLDDEALKALAAAEVPAHFADLDKINLG